MLSTPADLLSSRVPCTSGSRSDPADQVYDRAHWKHEPARVYLAPLKLLILDPVDGALRMMWWPANNGLKVPASLLQGSATDAGVLRFDDADRGAIVEGCVFWLGFDHFSSTSQAFSAATVSDSLSPDTCRVVCSGKLISSVRAYRVLIGAGQI